MNVAIILDSEFLVCEGAQSRYWCGPLDPDPIIVQYGAIKIGLSDDFPIIDKLRVFIKPIDRFGNLYPLDPAFVALTGITEDIVADKGVGLKSALNSLDEFSEGSSFWSWGKDEFNTIAISCYVGGLAPVVPATRFDNACKLVMKAGMPYDDLCRTRSSMLADYFNIEHPPLRAHDALDDAFSLTYVLQHLLRIGKLNGTDLQIDA